MVSKLKLFLFVASSVLLSSQAANTNLEKMKNEIATEHPKRDTNVIPVTEVNDVSDLGVTDVPKHEDRTTDRVIKEDVKSDEKQSDQTEDFEFIPIVLLRGNRGGLYVFQPFQQGGDSITDRGGTTPAANPDNNAISGEEVEDGEEGEEVEEGGDGSPDKIPEKNKKMDKNEDGQDDDDDDDDDDADDDDDDADDDDDEDSSSDSEDSSSSDDKEDEDESAQDEKSVDDKADTAKPVNTSTPINEPTSEKPKPVETQPTSPVEPIVPTPV